MQILRAERRNTDSYAGDIVKDIHELAILELLEIRGVEELPESETTVLLEPAVSR
jgi:hypothetical protein